MKSSSFHSDSGYSTLPSKHPSSQTSSTMYIHTSNIDRNTYTRATVKYHNDDIYLRIGNDTILAYMVILPHSEWSDIPVFKLHAAAFNGEIARVRFLVEVLHCDNFLLHTAAACGDLIIVKYFIEDRQVNAATESMNKETPLHLAALNGHLHIVKYLVSTQLVDPTSLDNNNCSPLHNACRSGNVDVVKYLMSEIQNHQLLDVNEKAIDGITPIHFAAATGRPNLIRFLLKELKPSFQVIAECDLQSKDEVIVIIIIVL